MAILLEPKADFIRDTKAREAHAQIAADPFVHRTIGIALAEMHIRGLSPDAMAGVNGFIFTWLNLGEKDVAPRQIPNKHLESFGQPTTTKTTVSES